MARMVLRGTILNRILAVAACLLTAVCLHAPLALAQHVGGHVGGGGMHGAPGPIHAPIAHAPIARGPITRAPIAPLRAPFAPPLGAFRGGVGLYHPRPIGPWRPRPIYPIYGYGYPWFFGGYYPWLWSSWNYNSCWYVNAYPCWDWGLGSNYVPFYSYIQPNYYAPPLSYQYYGGGSRELPELYMKDGSVYNVTDYWVVDNQLHFMVLEGRKSVEHVVDVDELDLQATIDANTDRGFRFVLRNEPMQQYEKDHPNEPPPEWTAPPKQ